MSRKSELDKAVSLRDITDSYPEVAGWYYCRVKGNGTWTLANFGGDSEMSNRRKWKGGECIPAVMPNAEGEAVITAGHTAFIEKGARLHMAEPKAFIHGADGEPLDLDSPEGAAELRNSLLEGIPEGAKVALDRQRFLADQSPENTKDMYGRYLQPSLRIGQLIQEKRHPEDRSQYGPEERVRGILLFLDEVFGRRS